MPTLRLGVSRERNSTASPARSDDVRRQWLPTLQRVVGNAGNADFARFLGIAAGSASELEYHFLLARDLELLMDEEYRTLEHSVVEVKRMLASLIRKVEAERLAG